jgi:anti-sigma regulatory factor (Ser/Thr protein kinase)
MNYQPSSPPAGCITMMTTENRIPGALPDKGQETVLSMNLLLPGNSRELSLIRKIIQIGATTALFSEHQANDLKLAVTEICTNVIKHAFHNDEHKRYEVHLEISRESFTAVIRYADPDFFPETIPPPSFDSAAEGGWGVFIVRNLMDKVEYHKDQSTGKIELRLEKNLQSPEGNKNHEN